MENILCSNFTTLSEVEMDLINGGAKGGAIFSGAVFMAIGIGLCSIAIAPAIPFVVVVSCAIVGTQAIIGGSAAIAYGAVS